MPFLALALQKRSFLSRFSPLGSFTPVPSFCVPSGILSTLFRTLTSAAVLSTAVTFAAESPHPATHRGAPVAWARLRVGLEWNRHAEGDPYMLSFFRNNMRVNIAPEVYSADPGDLDAMCRYPFLFAESVAALNPAQRANLAEYVRRGGFLCLDACEDHNVNPSVPAYLQAQVLVLRAALPELRFEVLPPSHEIFGNMFQMTAFPPTPRGGAFRPTDGNHLPMTALVLDGRIVGVISLGGMQCARTGHNGPLQGVACTQMMANIYVYALSH